MGEFGCCWWLAVGGSWLLVELVAVGGSWRRLVVGNLRLRGFGSWRPAVCSVWRPFAAGGWWRLVLFGRRLVAVVSLRRLAVCGWWSLRAVLKGCP